jgi:hypothetical protein
MLLMIWQTFLSRILIPLVSVFCFSKQDIEQIYEIDQCERLSFLQHIIGELDSDMFLSTVPWEGGLNEYFEVSDGLGNATWLSILYSKLLNIISYNSNNKNKKWQYDI